MCIRDRLNPLIIIIVLGALMLVLAPTGASQRVALFILVVPSVPLFIEAFIPFPGINFLAALNNYGLAVIVLLLPVLLYPRPDDHPRETWTLSSLCLFAYAAYSAVMIAGAINACLLYTSPSPRDRQRSRMPSSA